MIWLIGNKGMLGTDVESLLKNEGMNYIASDQEIDITNVDELQKFAQSKPITWIVNCAAYTAVDKAEDEPKLAFKINAEGPQNIAAVAKQIGAKLIHISTDYVFDGTKKDAYTETDTPNPLGVYGASKLLGEDNIKKTLNEHFILRTAWLYGKHGNNFVYTMLRLFKERDEVRVVGDQFGTPTYAPDLAQVILKIMQINSKAYGIYHFTNEGKTTWYDFASQIYGTAKQRGLVTKDIVILKITTDQYPTKAKRSQNTYLSKEKIQKTFNIDVRPWQKGLNDFLKGGIT